MEKRTLWIHAGGSKTGSSALQNFFELNTEYLNTQGIAYSNSVNIQFDYEVTSGNGMLLFESFMYKSLSEEELTDVILSYFEDFFPNAVCSSEYLQHLNDEALFRLLDIGKKNKIEIKFIYYIRNVFSYFISAYDQSIKRHGEWRDITEWSQEATWDHLQAAKTFSQVIPKDNLYIYSYEHSKSQLITHFMNVIGLQLTNEIMIEKINSKKVNRSLTSRERELFRRINKEFGDKYSTEISDRLIYKNPDFASEQEWDDSLIMQLTDRYHNDIKWVNDSFFEGEAVVKVFDDTSIKNSNTLTDNYRQAVDNEVIDWFISKVKSLEIDSFSNNISYVTSKLSAIDWENASNPAIPEDFNPFAYLLFNSDVLQSGESPYDHFIKHGQYEERKYQW